MHIVVCIKQVPDSSQIRVHPVTNTIMRQGVPAVVNPYDLFALEEALRLKDTYGAQVTVLCMGPPPAEAALRKAISFGADDAILITDRAFAGSDTLATSFALASAIGQIGATWPWTWCSAASRPSTATPPRSAPASPNASTCSCSPTSARSIAWTASGAKSSSSAAPKAACRCCRRACPA